MPTFTRTPKDRAADLLYSVRDAVHAESVGKVFAGAKKVLGHDKVKTSLKTSNESRREKIDEKQRDGQMLSLRKKLQVDSKTFARIQEGKDRYVAKDLKNAVRLIDHVVDQPLYGTHLMEMFAENALKGDVEKGRNVVLRVLEKQIASKNLNKVEGDVARNLVKSLFNSLEVRNGKLKYSPDTDAFDDLRAQKDKRNDALHHLDKKMEKVGVRASIAGNKLGIAKQKTLNAGTTAARKAISGLTAGAAATVATAAVGAAAVAGTAGLAAAPVAMAGRGLWNVGKGLAAGAKAAGQSVRASTQKDARDVGDYVAGRRGGRTRSERKDK